MASAAILATRPRRRLDLGQVRPRTLIPAFVVDAAVERVEELMAAQSTRTYVLLDEQQLRASTYFACSHFGGKFASNATHLVLVKMKVKKMEVIQRIGSERRHEMIAEAAYFRAEQRGFDGGDPLIDWAQAEAEIDAMLGNAASNRFVDRLEEQVATASKRLKALKKKVGGMKADARREWQHDIEKLAELRDSLETRLEEIRERGEHASRKAQKQAEKIWAEISEIIQRTTSRC